MLSVERTLGDQKGELCQDINCFVNIVVKNI